jgi:hypothetical protein
MKKYQLVKWRRWVGFGFTRTDCRKTCLALIYDWFFSFGFWELRKWANGKKCEKVCGRGKE